MNTLFDYLKRYGRIPFSLAPLNEADLLILSMFSYINYSGFVGGADGLPVRLSTVAPSVLEYGWAHKHDGVTMLPKILKLFEEAKDTRRFGRISIWNYEAEQDKEKEMQFAAVSFLIPERKTVFVSFRGTDSSIVGWKEDFNMSYIPVIPSQERASRYFNNVVSMRSETILVGGHSKGGNLALYSALHSPMESWPRIAAILDYDSPGLDPGCYELPSFAALSPKRQSFVPQSSIVGMLMRQDDDYIVVKSNAPGPMQHDPLTWEIKGKGFVRLKERTGFSKKSEEALDRLFASLSAEERQQFVDTVFSIVEATNAARFSDLGTDPLQKLAAMVKTYRALSEEEKAILMDSLKALKG